MRQAEKEKKKILVPNSVYTRPGHEHSQKNSKEIQKIIKPLPCFIFSQNGMRQAEKEKKKKFQAAIPFILDPGKKIPKKILKKFKKYKTSSRQYFQPKWDDISQKGENKILVPNSVQSRRGQENSEKIVKKFKN